MNVKKAPVLLPTVYKYVLQECMKEWWNENREKGFEPQSNISKNQAQMGLFVIRTGMFFHKKIALKRGQNIEQGPFADEHQPMERSIDSEKLSTTARKSHRERKSYEQDIDH